MPNRDAARERAAWGFHEGMPELATEGRPLSSFEDAPAFLFYFPVGVYWTWLSLKYLSIGLPSLANPSISAGGLCGESKSDVLNLLGPQGRAVLAPFVTVGDRDVEQAQAAMEDAGLAFPEVANHCKGAIFRNGQRYVTREMETAFARISDEIPDFYFGRFDVRFRSLDDLQQGRGFTIIEVNGAGSEATHIWDRQTRLIDAY